MLHGKNSADQACRPLLMLRDICPAVYNPSAHACIMPYRSKLALLIRRTDVVRSGRSSQRFIVAEPDMRKLSGSGVKTGVLQCFGIGSRLIRYTMSSIQVLVKRWPRAIPRRSVQGSAS